LFVPTSLQTWGDLLKGWLKLVPSSGRFYSVDAQVVSLDAADYVASDPLDLDHLTGGQ